jgi:hypothetical protein
MLMLEPIIIKLPKEPIAILYNDIISLEILSSCCSCEGRVNSGQLQLVQGQGPHVSATFTRISSKRLDADCSGQTVAEVAMR